MTQRGIDILLAIIATIFSVLLSWPFWRDFGYWPESHAMWQLYFALGSVLAIYVFYAFFGSLRTLFEHDALGHANIDTRQAAPRGQGDQA
jgi:hypothetical protein